MYYDLLIVHSFVRWLVLASLVFVLVRAFVALRQRAAHATVDMLAVRIAIGIFLMQLSLGVWLYLISPLVDYFLLNFRTAVHQREPRFFGMEHVTMMLVAALILIVGAYRVHTRKSDSEKFKETLRWFGAALFVVLVSIPWGFAPLVDRPLFRLN